MRTARPPRRRVLACLLGGLAGTAALTVAGPALARTRPVRVLTYGGAWPRAFRDWIERIHGIRIEVEPVPDPRQARRRVQRATFAGPQAAPGRGGPIDLVCLGLEVCEDWRAEGLLQPLPADLPSAPPQALEASLRRMGAHDADGRRWLLPMVMGFDAMFAGPPVSQGLGAALTPGQGQAPTWDSLLDPALDGALLMEPDGAVWMALRRLDPNGERLAAAAADKTAARDLFREVRDHLKPYRDHLRAVWTDTGTFVAALDAAAKDGRGLAGQAWDGLIRRLIRHGMTPPPLARVPAEGAAAWLDGLAMPVGGGAPDEAARLLSVLAQPGTQAVWAAAWDSIPVHAEGWAWLQADERRWVERTLAPSPQGDDGQARLWFRPRLEGPALSQFMSTRDRFEFG